MSAPSLFGIELPPWSSFESMNQNGEERPGARSSNNKLRSVFLISVDQTFFVGDDAMSTGPTYCLVSVNRLKVAVQ